MYLARSAGDVVLSRLICPGHYGIVPVVELIQTEAKSVASQAAQRMGELLTHAIQRRGLALLGLSGGRSVEPVLSELASLALDWQQIAIFLVDERCVPLDSPDSNWRMIEHELIARLRQQDAAVEERLYPYHYVPERIDMGIPIYRSRFADACAERGGAGSRGFDLALLGVGEDGHVASLFPRHPSVFSDMPDYLAVFGSPKPPPRRMSASRRLLADSGALILLFTGASKQAALQTFLNDSLSVERCPARVAFEAAAAWAFTDQPELPAPPGLK